MSAYGGHDPYPAWMADMATRVPSPCPDCGGRGVIECDPVDGTVLGIGMTTCDNCGGSRTDPDS